MSTKAEFQHEEAKANVAFYEYETDRLKNIIRYGGIVVDSEDMIDLKTTLHKLYIARARVLEIELEFDKKVNHDQF